MRKICIASGNKGKIKEIELFLTGLNIQFSLLLDTPNITDIQETGKTFEENAFIKAKAVFDIVNIPVLADDSGLEVDYLLGAPGVYSARYAGQNSGDKQNCEKLLKELEGIEHQNRSARFRCKLLLYNGMDKNYFDGVCEGYITTYPRGNNGFGYDPLFLPDGYSETFAELDPETKNKISHRGKAFIKLREYLKMGT